jgi:undecaprenyl-diphosphatase
MNPWANREMLFVLASLLAMGLVYVFLELSDEVVEGSTQRLDEAVVTWFRCPDDPAQPIGPSWLREAMMDATALGSPLIIGLVIAGAIGYLWVAGRSRLAWIVGLVVVVGGLFNLGSKYIIDRDRPTVVPHLREVTTPSFPSGHSMMSAIVFMSLGMLLARTMPTPALRAYLLAWGLAIPGLVGMSRVYLGVHYPTDVLAGWTAGLAYALASWLLAQWFEPRPNSSDKG